MGCSENDADATVRRQRGSVEGHYDIEERAQSSTWSCGPLHCLEDAKTVARLLASIRPTKHDGQYVVVEEKIVRKDVWGTS